jgi:hypothetical protein
MYLTVLSHFNIKQFNALGDICNENILQMSKGNVGKKNCFNCNSKFLGSSYISPSSVEGDYCKPLPLNSKFPSDILSDSM